MAVSANNVKQYAEMNVVDILKSNTFYRLKKMIACVDLYIEAVFNIQYITLLDDALN